MYFLTYHALPKADADTDGVGGAYINCYIIEDSLDQADKVARKMIEETSYEILTLDDSEEVDRNSISDSKRKYYEQALIDEAVCVIYTYPIEEGQS